MIGFMHYIELLVWAWLMLSLGHDRAIDDFPKAFKELASEAISIPIQGSFDFDPYGGHLQGIQLFSHNGQKEIFLSGSSSKVAFMVRARLVNEAKIITVDTLMMDPYRHAGGFQIFDHYLAIGIEDNYLRNSSKVMVYDLEKPTNTWADPLYVIERDGETERVTAGAVGLTKIKNHILLAVANWDCRDIDFYACPWPDFQKGEDRFQLIKSMDMEETQRTDWSDPQWHSYQNINLFNSKGEVYMVGLAKDTANNHLADLFRIEMEENFFDSPYGLYGTEKSFKQIQLKKLTTKFFFPSGASDFKAGAGLSQFQDGTIGLFACPYHIDGESAINIFSSKPYSNHPTGH